MLLGVTGVAVALAIGSIVLYAVLVVAIERTVDGSAHATASDVVRMAEAGTLPDPLPVSGAQVVQVVDAAGRIVAASVNADRLTPLLRPAELAQARKGAALTVQGARAGLSGPLRVVAAPVGPADRTGTVIVAEQVRDLEHSQRVLGRSLLVTYPLLLAVLAVISWWLIGRTLGPVEGLRAGAARISGTGRDERLPVPDTADEVHALAVTLNDMLDRLATSRERQRTFVADAAHELRSPLASMRTQLEVAQRLGEGGELADDLLADVQRLSRMVEDLLLLARAGADHQAPSRRESFDAQSLLGEVAGRYAAARVPVHVATGAAVFVSADREELRRVLSNLVDNAVRHAGTEVVLAAEVREGQGLLTVTDDGPGIPLPDRQRVFDRFTRLDDARSRDAGGSGLGLAIVRELLRRSGGTITLADAAQAPPAAGAAPAGAEGGAAPSSGPGLRAEVRLPR
jgi:signal transduction histidine kinase